LGGGISPNNAAATTRQQRIVLQDSLRLGLELSDAEIAELAIDPWTVVGKRLATEPYRVGQDRNHLRGGRLVKALKAPAKRLSSATEAL